MALKERRLDKDRPKGPVRNVRGECLSGWAEERGSVLLLGRECCGQWGAMEGVWEGIVQARAY